MYFIFLHEFGMLPREVDKLDATLVDEIKVLLDEANKPIKP